MRAEDAFTPTYVENFVFRPTAIDSIKVHHVYLVHCTLLRVERGAHALNHLAMSLTPVLLYIIYWHNASLRPAPVQGSRRSPLNVHPKYMCKLRVIRYCTSMSSHQTHKKKIDMSVLDYTSIEYIQKTMNH